MIELPSWVAPATVTPRYIDFGHWNTPVMGGTHTRTDRPGNRFGLKVDLPPIPANGDGAELLACLIAAKDEGLRFRWEKIGETYTPAETAAEFSISGTKGTSVSLVPDAARANIRKGTFFSFMQSDRSYLHVVDEDLDTGSENVLKLRPPLRTATVAGTALDFQTPVIDGIVHGEEWEWELSLAHHLGLSFDLVERW